MFTPFFSTMMRYLKSKVIWICVPTKDNIINRFDRYGDRGDFKILVYNVNPLTFIIKFVKMVQVKSY